MVGIYKITNLITGESYVGRSVHIEERWKEHFCKGYGARHSARFQEAIDLYGKEGFSFQILEECASEVLSERERYWINTLRPEYNTVTDGHIISPETRAKISASLTGKKQPADVIEKRKASIKELHKTHPQTNEGHRKKVAVQINEIMEFESVKAMAEYMGVDASTVTSALKRNGKVKGKKVWYVV